MVIGYTTGVFDLFHVGHLNLLRNAKGLCDTLIVGVTVDELVGYKKCTKPVIPFTERLEIIQSISYVNLAVAQDNMDKLEAYNKYKFNILFVGDDWYGTEKWHEIECTLSDLGVRTIYLPYTKSTSSTKINNLLDDLRAQNNE